MAKTKKAPARRTLKRATERKPRQHTKHMKLIETLRRPTAPPSHSWPRR